MHNLYEILEISPDATQYGIRQAFRISGFRWYPDVRLKGMEDYTIVRYAYTVLSHPEARRLYDVHRLRFPSRIFLPLHEKSMRIGTPSPHGLYEITLNFLIAKGELELAFRVARLENDYQTIEILVKSMVGDLVRKGEKLSPSREKIKIAAQSAGNYLSLHDLVRKHLSH